MKNVLQEPLWFTPPDGSSTLWKDSPEPPASPDPWQTAAAQTGQNTAAARTQARLNRVNSRTPFGTTTYTEQPGDRWESSVQLDPRLQGGVDSSISRISDNLTNPFGLGVPAAPTIDNAERQRVADQMMARLEPKFAQDDEALRTRLANQGLKVGSEGYRREMETQSQGRNDARIQADIAAGGEMANLFGLGTQARNNALAEQNIPINQLNALLTGSQLAQPSGVGVNPADISGNIYANYQGQQDAYNQKVGSRNANTAAGASLAGSALMAFMLSDKRMKEDITKVGMTDSGLPVYTFRYKGDPCVYMGVMAQEAGEMFPDAVHDIEGVLYVDYGRIH